MNISKIACEDGISSSVHIDTAGRLLGGVAFRWIGVVLLSIVDVCF